MAVASFQNGLSRDGSRATRKPFSRLMKYPPTTWDEIHNAYYAKVRADEEYLNGQTHRLISVQTKSIKERRDNIRRDHPFSRPNKERHQPYVRPPTTPSLRYEEEINYPLEKLGTKVKWMPKMRSDPNTRKSDALCEFYQERGHKIEDCIAFRQEVINMLRQGHLKELLSVKGRNNFARGREHQGLPNTPSPSCTINMIIGGSDDASINGVKFTTTHKLKRSITRERYDVLGDADGLTLSHNDALVITLRILDTNIKCIMVDDGSGACILHPRVLTQNDPRGQDSATLHHANRF
nr:uncharacterized protein LOC104099128 [Nicotiana tomentosiformis]